MILTGMQTLHHRDGVYQVGVAVSSARSTRTFSLASSILLYSLSAASVWARRADFCTGATTSMPFWSCRGGGPGEPGSSSDATTALL